MMTRSLSDHLGRDGRKPRQPGTIIEDEFLTKPQLAALFGVSERTVERWVRLRSLPAPTRVGRQRLWHRDRLITFLTEGPRRGARR